jgi:hypothetical protein
LPSRLRLLEGLALLWAAQSPEGYEAAIAQANRELGACPRAFSKFTEIRAKEVTI